MSSNKPVKVAATPTKAIPPFEGSFGFPLFNRLSREFDAIFNRLGIENSLLEPMPAVWTPQLEMLTKENELLVKVDVPGMKKDDITIETTDDLLVVRGERKQEKEEKKEGFYRSERSYGSFYRSVPLPEGVKPDLAKAALHDGVLEITMPMTKVEAKTNKIEIAETATPTATKAA